MKLRKVRLFNDWLLFVSGGRQIHLAPLQHEHPAKYDHLSVPLEGRLRRGVEAIRVHLSRHASDSIVHHVLRDVPVARVQRWWKSLELRLLEAGRAGVEKVDISALDSEGYIFVGADEARIQDLIESALGQREIHVTSASFDNFDDYAVRFEVADLNRLASDSVSDGRRMQHVGLLHPDGLAHSGKMMTFVDSGSFYGYEAPGWFVIDATPLVREMIKSLPPELFVILAQALDKLGRPSIAARLRTAPDIIRRSFEADAKVPPRPPSN